VNQLPHPSPNGFYEKEKAAVQVRMWIKGTLHPVGGTIISTTLFLKNWRFLKNLKIEPSSHPAILLLGTYPKETMLKFYLYCCISFSTIQQMKMTYVPIN
jgi:hypothetical protein